MAALTQQEQQVVEAFRSLEPSRRRIVLLEMTRADRSAWKRYRPEGEATLREIARQRGVHWDGLDDEQRQTFVESLLNEPER